MSDQGRGAARSTTVTRSATTTGSTGAAHPDGTSERTLGQLVADASHDVSAIVRSEVALAKAELRADAVSAVTGVALFVVAGVVVFLATLLLLVAAAYGLVAAGLSRWLAFLVVAGALLLVSGILAVTGRAQLKRARAPERTLRTTRATVATLRGARGDHVREPTTSGQAPKAVRGGQEPASR
ncbi:MAG: phage holin family protein [Angustibacter sp.]